MFPQYLWWGPSPLGQALAFIVIFAGAWWILRKVRMVGMAVSFLATFAVLVAILAVSGREFVAIWHDGPINGLSYWANLAISPEVLIFVFFMISDPQTAPKAPLGRVIYGASTAMVAAALLSFQTTEFAIKLSILSSLTVVCALVPLIENVVRRLQARPRAALAGAMPRWPQVAAAARNPVIVAAAVITLFAPLNTAALAGDEEILLIERGLAGKNAQ